MTQWENQVEQKHHGKPFPEVLISGEGVFPEEPLTPPSSFTDLPSDLPPAGHREFLRKRRFLGKVLQHLQASGLPGQELVQTFLLHLYRRNCRPNTLRAYAGAIQLFLTFLHHAGKAHLEALARGDLEAFLEEELTTLFSAIKRLRDRALFLLMLRSGLRVEEVAKLSLEALDLTRGRVHVHHGKGGKDRVVYISPEFHGALVAYLQLRPRLKAKQVFLVEKGPYTGNPLSVRGIQKLLDYYARKTRVTTSCHHLRHTMATQLLNADAALVSIQDLLGHTVGIPKGRSPPPGLGIFTLFTGCG